MPAYFETGFMVREPAWHGLGEVLDEYPGREEGMRIAGHDFTVVERPVYVDLVRQPRDDEALAESFRANVGGWKGLIREKDGDDDKVLHIAKSSYGVVQNEIGWDIVDAIVSEPNVRYETAGVLKGGAVCWVLAWLDEPVVIPGDDSAILPYVNVCWTHDGSGAITARSTSVRVVCWNTQSAAETQGKRLGVDYTFRHTKNVMQQIEDAKLALAGVRVGHEEYVELARELAGINVTESQRELFVTQFLPMPPEALISERVVKNVENGRTELRNLFSGSTVPEPHRFTAYGLHLAGVEYLDHLRGWRNRETYFGRTMLRNEPAKAKIATLIREVVKA